MHLLWGRGWRTPGWSPTRRLLARIRVVAGAQLVVDGSPDLFLSATLDKANRKVTVDKLRSRMYNGDRQDAVLTTLLRLHVEKLRSRRLTVVFLSIPRRLPACAVNPHPFNFASPLAGS